MACMMYRRPALNSRPFLFLWYENLDTIPSVDWRQVKWVRIKVFTLHEGANHSWFTQDKKNNFN